MPESLRICSPTGDHMVSSTQMLPQTSCPPVVDQLSTQTKEALWKWIESGVKWECGPFYRREVSIDTPLIGAFPRVRYVWVPSDERFACCACRASSASASASAGAVVNAGANAMCLMSCRLCCIGTLWHLGLSRAFTKRWGALALSPIIWQKGLPSILR